MLFKASESFLRNHALIKFLFYIKAHPLQTLFLLSLPRPCGDGFKPAYICVLVLHLMLSNHKRDARFLSALNVLATAAA